MPKTTTMTVRLTPELSDKLEALARAAKRSKSFLAGEAIASYVEMNAWQVGRIKKALAEARSGVPGVPHEEVVRWVASWDTDNERPRPRPKPRPNRAAAMSRSIVRARPSASGIAS